MSLPSPIPPSPHFASIDNQSLSAVTDYRLECVSLPIPAEIGFQTANPFSPSPNDPKVPTHDFWLVLRVGTFEMPLMPEQYLYPSEDVSRAITYSLASPTVQNASLQLTLPLPASAADMEDLDSFEVLLRQYGALKPDDTALTNVTAKPLGTSNAPLPEDMRGKVVLINQDNGEVVGELSESIDVETDGKVLNDNKNKPVILDFGNEIAGYAPKVKIQTVPEDELDDWMLKSAHTLSYVHPLS
jgi:spartin